jgi:hypothetical protein
MTEQELINIINDKAISKANIDRAFTEACLTILDEPKAETFEEADKYPDQFDWNKLYFIYCKRFGDTRWHTMWGKAMEVLRDERIKRRGE